MTKYLSYAFILAALSAILSGCGGVKPRVAEERPITPVTKPAAEPDAESMKKIREYKQSGKFLDAALIYTRLARESKPPTKQKYQFSATQALLEGNYLVQASQLLDEINVQGLDESYFVQKQTLFAQVAIGKQQPNSALQILDKLQTLSVPPEQKAKIHRLRAQAYEMSGNLLASAEQRIQLDSLLTDTDAIKDNQLAIIQTLRRLPDATLKQMLAKPTSDTLKGWVDLAIIAKTALLRPTQLQQQIQQWRLKYPSHEALEDVVANLLYREKPAVPTPTKIALLLPQQGQFANLAKAVRDGFLAAYYIEADPNNRPVVEIYDTGAALSDINAVYDQAVQDGADFVVGPLDKRAATLLAARENLAVPTMALNYIGNEMTPPVNLFQFGLSPEDEASQVAERAWLDGYMRAAVLVPEGDWGERILTAFKSRWDELGGEIAEYQTYQPKENDYSAPIRRVFNIDDSEERNQTLRSVIGERVVFNPRRRQDVDFVFIVANPRQARLIRPQLKFQYAGDLPVYATSHIYTGKVSAELDRDLNGVVFGDMPWVLPGSSKKSALHRTIVTIWPESSGSYMPLYALGIDAFHLIPNLNRLISYRSEYFVGETGNLYLDDQNRIHRRLVWAEFRNGVPQIIETTLSEDVAQTTDAM
jgi:outer membrane PBP1 activator LpoA protein